MKHKMLYILPVLLLVAGIVGYQFSLDSGITEMSTSELAETIENKNHDNVFFLDVREVYEYNERHIKEMVNVPLSTLENDYSAIPMDQTIVIICRSGNRSLQAASILQDLGYDDLINVKGGMLAWEGEVR